MKISARHKQIELFKGYYTKFGGHSQWLAKVTGLDYLIIGLRSWQFDFVELYYDGWHSGLFLGWFVISWGGKPLLDGEEANSGENGLCLLRKAISKWQSIRRYGCSGCGSCSHDR